MAVIVSQSWHAQRHTHTQTDAYALLWNSETTKHWTVCCAVQCCGAFQRCWFSICGIYVGAIAGGMVTGSSLNLFATGIENRIYAQWGREWGPWVRAVWVVNAIVIVAYWNVGRSINNGALVIRVCPNADYCFMIIGRMNMLNLLLVVAWWVCTIECAQVAISRRRRLAVRAIDRSGAIFDTFVVTRI